MYPFNAERTVELFFELYAVLVNLAYIPFDAVSFPPHQLPPRDVARWGLTMDPVVLDLVKNLPYLKGRYGFTIAPGAKSKDLSRELWFAQHPLDWAEGEYEYVERWSLCLTDGLDGWESGWLVLDTRKGTITKVDWDNENGKPENTPENYYNYQEAVPIEDVLELWVKRFVNLEWIPWNGPGCETGEILRADVNEGEDRVHYQVMKEMYQSHGWPQTFRTNEFTAARDAYIQRVKEVHRLRGHEKMRQQIEEHERIRQQLGGEL